MLWIRPSFWRGAARTLDIFGGLDRHEVDENPAESDARAIYSDWQAVGDDMRAAIGAFANNVSDRTGNGNGGKRWRD